MGGGIPPPRKSALGKSSSSVKDCVVVGAEVCVVWVGVCVKFVEGVCVVCVCVVFLL